MAVPLKLYLFIVEIHNQARHALLAWRTVDDALGNRTDPEWTDRVWSGLQSFATAQANISKLFYNIKKKTYRDDLLAQFAIDLNPIHNRDMRDDFDHFDERIERLVAQLRPGVGVQDRAIGADVGVMPEPEQLRRYDPDAQMLTIRHKEKGVERFDLKPILECIRAIELEAGRLRLQGIE